MGKKSDEAIFFSSINVEGKELGTVNLSGWIRIRFRSRIIFVKNVLSLDFLCVAVLVELSAVVGRT